MINDKAEVFDVEEDDFNCACPLSQAEASSLPIRKMMKPVHEVVKTEKTPRRSQESAEVK